VFAFPRPIFAQFAIMNEVAHCIEPFKDENENEVVFQDSVCTTL
jgi:hypothetical protein